jgi:hypothetical protein
MAHVVEHLLIKHKDLSSNPNTAKKKIPFALCQGYVELFFTHWAGEDPRRRKVSKELKIMKASLETT